MTKRQAIDIHTCLTGGIATFDLCSVEEAARIILRMFFKNLLPLEYGQWAASVLEGASYWHD